MKKQVPKISDLKIVDTQGVNDCKECALKPWCDKPCDLQPFTHYEL